MLCLNIWKIYFSMITMMCWIHYLHLIFDLSCIGFFTLIQTKFVLNFINHALLKSLISFIAWIIYLVESTYVVFNHIRTMVNLVGFWKQHYTCITGLVLNSFIQLVSLWFSCHQQVSIYTCELHFTSIKSLYVQLLNALSIYLLGLMFKLDWSFHTNTMSIHLCIS